VQTLLVDGLTFEFPDSWILGRYDQWSFYRNRFSRIGNGLKALDLLAVSPSRVAWLVEVKDYRVHQRTKPSNLAEEVSQKVLDTLAAILPSKINGDDPDEVRISTRVMRAIQLRVVLHLEQPAKHSKLFPRAIDPANVHMELRRKLKAIDAHPVIAEIAYMHGLEWNVS
jgi:hypothetical protein